MRCKICREEISREKEFNIKGRGKICESCFSRLPVSAQHHISELTKKQIMEIGSIFRPASSTPKFSFGRWHICFDSLILNGFEINIKHIRTINLSFHVKQYAKIPNTCVGITLLVIETDKDFIVKEPIFSYREAIKFYIYNDNIRFSFSPRVQQAVSIVQQAIDSGAPDFSGVFNRLYPEDAAIHSVQDSQDFPDLSVTPQPFVLGPEQVGIVGEEDEKTEFESALSFYQISVPFSSEDLNAKQRELQKRFHPDHNSGSAVENDASALINHYYDVLKKYII